MFWLSTLSFTAGVLLAGFCLLALSPGTREPARRLRTERLALLAARVLGAVGTLAILLLFRIDLHELDVLLLSGPLVAAALPLAVRRAWLYLVAVASAAVFFLVAGEFGGVWLAFYFWPCALLFTSAGLLARRRIREGGEAGDAGTTASRGYEFASGAALVVPILALVLAAARAG